MKNTIIKAMRAGALALLLALPLAASAQDGLAGINEANQQVRSYFDAGNRPYVCCRCDTGPYRCGKGLPEMECRRP
jgi:hypothetical protein